MKVNKGHLILIGLVLLLAAVYSRYASGWLFKQTIHISALNRPRLPNWPAELPYISFKFDRPRRLTHVKVVTVSELATNKYPSLYWELTTDAKSDEVNYVLYGLQVDGMKTSVPPSPLDPHTTYRLIVKAGRHTGHIDFSPVEIGGQVLK